MLVALNKKYESNVYILFASVGITYGLTSFSQKLSKRSNVISNVLTLPSFNKRVLCAFWYLFPRQRTVFKKGGGCFVIRFLQKVFEFNLEGVLFIKWTLTSCSTFYNPNINRTQMDNKLQYWIELNRVKLFYKTIALFWTKFLY